LRLSADQSQALNTEAQIKELHDYLAKSIGLVGVISLERQFSRYWGKANSIAYRNINAGWIRAKGKILIQAQAWRLALRF
jgi:hypothetical protein